MTNRAIYGLIFTLSLSLIFVSCTPWRATYLKQGVNEANQNDITKKLGPPHLIRELDSGEEVWFYQYQPNFMSGDFDGTVCREYILTFDKNKILRNWVRQEC